MQEQLDRIEHKVDELLTLFNKAAPAPNHSASDERVPIDGAFKDSCYVLEKHELCTPDWAKALSQWRGMDSISAKQYKFYCVIYKQILGSYPSKTTAAPAAKAPISDTEMEIPF